MNDPPHPHHHLQRSCCDTLRPSLHCLLPFHSVLCWAVAATTSPPLLERLPTRRVIPIANGCVRCRPRAVASSSAYAEMEEQEEEPQQQQQPQPSLQTYRDDVHSLRFSHDDDHHHDEEDSAVGSSVMTMMPCALVVGAVW